MSPKLVPVEDVIVETISGLLPPLQSLLPGSAEKVMKALAGGRRVEQAGLALVDSIQEQIKVIQAAEAEKQSALYRSTADLEQKVRDCQRQIQLRLEEIDKLNKLISEKEKTICDLRTTISRQNHLLADQHEQITNLCGVSGNDAHA
jgi:chromosome segregation ATPase